MELCDIEIWLRIYTWAFKRWQVDGVWNFLEELPYGSLFKIKDGRIFQKGEKLRKRFKCSETHTNLVYLFSPIYEVKPLTEVEKI